MSFNSVEYFCFLPTVLLLYSLLDRREWARDLFLLCASYFFYMSWNWKYAGLIALSTMVDYLVGRWMAGEDRPQVRRLLLIASLFTNLGLLGLFKYYNFFVDIGEESLSVFGVDASLIRSRLLLPVGISFYTFQTLSYTIDIYRKQVESERSLVKFALFVSFFPQLVAGPIVRARDFLPQLHRRPNIDSYRISSGLLLVFQGLFKKIVIADLLATLLVDDVFASPNQFGAWDLLLALYGYSFQIYNDFSGYSDIAIGSARLLGFDLPENFDRPYLARNVREFWSRWHISLSTWLRDYLYFPLGGSRTSRFRTDINLMLTMLLGGLWHGSGINFVLWGAYHGILLVVAHARNQAHRGASRHPWKERLVCFHLVTWGWLLFRIGDLSQFLMYTRGLGSFLLPSKAHGLYFAILFLAIATHFISPKSLERWASRWVIVPAFVQGGVYAAFLLLFWACSVGTPTFIYFQF